MDNYSKYFLKPTLNLLMSMKIEETGDASPIVRTHDWRDLKEYGGFIESKDFKKNIFPT